MSYCPKCGAKIEDGDLYCYSCGYKVGDGEAPAWADKNTQYTEKPVIDYEKNKELTHPVAKAGFILSIIGLGLMVVGFIVYIIAYNRSDERIGSLGSSLFTFGLVGGCVALGLSIGGFVMTKKKGFKKTIATAALVLSIIAVAIVLVYYIYEEYFYN